MANRYVPEELYSFIKAHKKIGDSVIETIGKPSILVPMRGSFLPSFLVGLGRTNFNPNSVYFWPESGFLHKTKDISLEYLHKFYSGQVNFFHKKGIGVHSPVDKNGKINVFIVDEAKSGNAISQRIHKYSVQIIENLKEEEARLKLAEIQKLEIKTAKKKLDLEVKNLKRMTEENEKSDLNELERVKQIADAKKIKFVNERGDYTPEAITILKVLRRNGLIDEKDFKDSCTHRWLVDTKLSYLIRPQSKNKVREEIIKEAQKSINANISHEFNKKEDLVKDIPSLEKFYVENFKKLPNESKQYVQFDENLNPELYFKEHSDKYVSSYATITNYRISKFNEFLDILDNKNGLVGKIDQLIQIRKDETKKQWQNTLQILEKYPNGKILERENGNQLLNLLKQTSDYNRIRLHIFAIHGIDYPAIVGRYYHLKDEGEIYEIPTNRIITMDNPITPIEYDKLGKRIVHPYKFENTVQFNEFMKDVSNYYPGVNLNTQFSKYKSRLTTHYDKYVRKVVENYLESLRKEKE